MHDRLGAGAASRWTKAVWFAAALLVAAIGGTGPVWAATGPELAATPPMGWNSWNHFGKRVTEADVKAAADELVASGMAAAGYRYVVIDDTWQGQRNAAGELQPNAKFPDMPALAKYIHSKGLKFGIYSSPGKQTCAEHVGSFGHVAQDAKLFASWGVDYLKYDLCSYRKQLVGKTLPEQAKMMQQVYAEMHSALLATGRPVVYSLCSYGWGKVWQWGASVGGNLWRTTEDIEPTYQSMWFNALSQQGLAKFAGPGHWNDPDMLEIGNGKIMSDINVEETQMSLWSLLAAPLIAGNDLATMTSATRAVLTNREVIAIDQDPRGVQGQQLWQQGGLRLWAKPLADGTIAVGLFNTLDHALESTLNLSALGIHGDTAARNLWTHKDLGRITDAHEFVVPAGGVVLLKIGTPNTDAVRG